MLLLGSTFSIADDLGHAFGVSQLIFLGEVQRSIRGVDRVICCRLLGSHDGRERLKLIFRRQGGGGGGGRK